MSKPIQIAAGSVAGVEDLLYVLCDDGTIYERRGLSWSKEIGPWDDVPSGSGKPTAEEAPKQFMSVDPTDLYALRVAAYCWLSANPYRVNLRK